ncbi:MAG TPA: Uma2 family endonuclease [Gemmatimonadaceae bacterium]|nr:Uma2 family endonuclease [Gemmatimonadaceae bacterium]
MTDATYTRPMTAAAPMTAEELMRLNLPNQRTELVRGVLRVREPAGYRHGDVAATALILLGSYVREYRLGRVFAAETGFTLERAPDTVRAPDVAFISTARLLPRDTRGYALIAPDLVVEFLSPDSRPGELLEKISDWLRAGTRLVWIIDPIRRAAQVYRADGTVAVRGENDPLEGEEVLPGFSCQLSEFLD